MDCRLIEPPTGLDAFMAALFPALAGGPPESGAHGTDRAGNLYTWRPEQGWVFTKAAYPQLEAEQHDAELEPG